MTCNFINTPYHIWDSHQSSSIKSGYLGGDDFLSHHSGSGFHVSGLSDGFHLQSIFFQMMCGILCRPWFSIKEHEDKSYQLHHHLQCITSKIILTEDKHKTIQRFCQIYRRGLFVFLVYWLFGSVGFSCCCCCCFIQCSNVATSSHVRTWIKEVASALASLFLIPVVC